MPYIFAGAALLLVFSAAWVIYSRQTAASQQRARRSPAAQKARLARLQPAEESSNQKTPKNKRRNFGNR